MAQGTNAAPEHETAGADAPVRSYGALLRVPGFRSLMTSALLSRTALVMSTVVFVLFSLARFHSASVAGLSVFLLIFPGLAVSPLTGALLDRLGRRRLMAADFVVAAAGVSLVSTLAQTGRLSVAGLLVIVSAVSLTSTLSAAGTRSLLPLTVPAHLWERANAADTIGYGAASVAGPALAGALTLGVGPSGALLFVAGGYLLAAIVLFGIHEPPREDRPHHGVLRDAWLGLRYVVHNRSLRWLAISTFFANVGFGMVIVALPLLVFRLHGNAGVVGELFACEGLVGIPASLLAGRLRMQGRERRILSLSDVVLGAVTLLLLLPAIPLLAVAMALTGASDGPAGVALFSFRQRRTQRAWYGRAFAVSMSLNYAGAPIGSALAGPLIARSLDLTVTGAAVLALISAVVVWRIPRHGDPPAA